MLLYFRGFPERGKLHLWWVKAALFSTDSRARETAAPEERWKRALEIAVRVHYSQADKRGEPYLFHIFRMTGDATTISGRICAAVHDTVEMSDLTVEQVAKAVELTTVERDALGLLSRTEGETYMQNIERMCGETPAHYLAAGVKLLDIKDHLKNMPPGEDWDSLRRRYQRAEARLVKYHRRLLTTSV